MNEIAKESQRLARNPIWQGYEKTGSATPVCRYPPWYPFHDEVSKEKKKTKKQKTNRKKNRKKKNKKKLRF